MPHLYPRYNPCLELAMPGDTVTGGPVITVGDPWLAEFGDGIWRQILVRYWRTDRHGRPVIGIEWFTPDGGAYTDAYLADQERMRRLPDSPPEYAPWSGD